MAVPSVTGPSVYEQYMIELVNRARENPEAEAILYGIDLNEGLSPGTITSNSKQPLASNQFLTDSANSHSQWMLDTNTFSHTGAGGSSAGDRMGDAGYVFSGSWTWGENIAWRGTTGTPNVTQYIELQHQSLFLSKGHRKNILNDNFREIGIGSVEGRFTTSRTWNAVMTTQNFAKSGSDVFLTGVAFDDEVNNNSFYNVGEGLAGITVEAIRTSDNAIFSTTTMSAGGYNLALNAGTYNVTFSDNSGDYFTETVTIGSENVKLDLDTSETPSNPPSENNAPDFTAQSFSLPENSANSTVIGTVVATDPDGDALTYQITQNLDIDGDGNHAFRL
ncbi:MAG: CAP domain-containing protein, partial [Microcystaceae cyanobacterium]